MRLKGVVYLHVFWLVSNAGRAHGLTYLYLKEPAVNSDALFYIPSGLCPLKRNLQKVSPILFV